MLENSEKGEKREKEKEQEDRKRGREQQRASSPIGTSRALPSDCLALRRNARRKVVKKIGASGGGEGCSFFSLNKKT